MLRSLEFHDSELVSVTQESATVTLALKGYVHQWERSSAEWIGTGWTQTIHIRVLNPRNTSAGQLGDISDGSLQSGPITHQNMVQLPFSSAADVRLELVLTDGSAVEVAGTGIRIEPQGEPTFVEKLPDFLRPTDAA